MAVENRVADLALLGGRPAFDSPRYVGRPNIGSRERLMARIDAMFDRLWLTNNGPLVQEFESKIAQFVGVRNCIVACNATVALEIVIRALGLRGEVIVPSFTFVATAHALQWQEITPVFCDVDPRTHNLDPRRIAALLTPRTTGILATHVWGRPCPVEELEEIARSKGLELLFDAAHAFGASHGGRMIGGFGRAEVFSFHATKFLNSFEGGAIVTNDDELAGRIRLMKNFGFSGYDNVVHVGTNGKMTEMAAAMGLTNLEEIDAFVATNRRNYDVYKENLSGISGLRLVSYDDSEKANYQYVVVEVDQEEFGLTRDELVKVLHAENILARRYFYPGCHRMEPYRSFQPNAGLLLKETEALSRRVTVLPNGTAVSSLDVRKIADVIRRTFEAVPEIRKALR
jgi:dTDP-4-amino-4,6-dideoxygalactose transaminase